MVELNCIGLHQLGSASAIPINGWLRCMGHFFSVRSSRQGPRVSRSDQTRPDISISLALHPIQITSNYYESVFQRVQKAWCFMERSIRREVAESRPSLGINRHGKFIPYENCLSLNNGHVRISGGVCCAQIDGSSCRRAICIAISIWS